MSFLFCNNIPSYLKNIYHFTMLRASELFISTEVVKTGLILKQVFAYFKPVQKYIIYHFFECHNPFSSPLESCVKTIRKLYIARYGSFLVIMKFTHLSLFLFLHQLF